MTSRDFCYWLQGFFELSHYSTLDAGQVGAVKNHLALVFKHEIDPSIDGGDPKKKDELNAIHEKPPQPPWHSPFPPQIRC